MHVYKLVLQSDKRVMPYTMGNKKLPILTTNQLIPLPGEILSCLLRICTVKCLSSCDQSLHSQLISTLKAFK